MTKGKNERRGPESTGIWTTVEMEDSYLKLLRGLLAGAEGNPAQLGIVRRIAAWIQSPEVLRFIAAEPEWIGDWEVKEALLRNSFAPADVRGVPERQIAVIDLLRELDEPGLEESEKQEIKEDARSLIGSLAPEERAAVRERAYELSRSRLESSPPSPAPITEAEFSFPEPVFEEIDTAELTDLLGGEADPDRLEEAPPETSAAPSSPSGAAPSGLAEESPEPAAEPVSHETPETEPGRPDRPADEEASALPTTAEAGDAAPAVEGEARDPEVQLALTSSDDEVLRKLAQGQREKVHRALLENPHIREALILPLARRAGTHLAGDLYRQRRWFNRPAIRHALLENPNAPALAQLATVSSLTDLRLLLQVLVSAKIRHLEVKSKARERIRTVFRTFSMGEKVTAVRNHGRRLLRHLWTDFFRDEALVLRCLQERQLDEGTVLEIARSRVAPRKALEKIGSTPAWTANYSIVLALVLNPKTPRQIAQRLLTKLNPSDRKRVKGSLSVAESVRRMA